MITIKIEGVDKTSSCTINQLNIADELNSRNTYSFIVESLDGAYRPYTGQDVEVIKDGITIFAGTIDDIVEYSPNNGITSALFFDCSCVDFNQICDRFLVADAYENQLSGDIVKAFIDNYLVGEDMTYINVEDGPIISKAVFDYKTITEALDEISEVTGYIWYVDYDKDMHFHSRLSNAAPFSLTATSENFRNISVKRTRSDYRNKQYFRGGQDISSIQIDTFKGDGETQTFPLKLPCALVPSVTVNSGARTIGIRQVESGKDWYWSKGEREITQDTGGVKLTSSDTLFVTYQGFFPIMIESQQETAITERKSVEGGTGIYEHVVTDRSVDTEDAVKERAEALLRKYGTIPEIIDFETDTDGLKAGQLIHITISTHNLDADYLIQRVSINDITNDTLRYQVTCLSGENIGGWVNFFKALAKSGQTYAIRENEVLIKIRQFRELLAVNDSLTVSSASPENRVGTARIGFSECS